MISALITAKFGVSNYLSNIVISVVTAFGYSHERSELIKQQHAFLVRLKTKN
jgi:hypothetical protein